MLTLQNSKFTFYVQLRYGIYQFY